MVSDQEINHINDYNKMLFSDENKMENLVNRNIIEEVEESE